MFRPGPVEFTKGLIFSSEIFQNEQKSDRKNIFTKGFHWIHRKLPGYWRFFPTRTVDQNFENESQKSKFWLRYQIRRNRRKIGDFCKIKGGTYDCKKIVDFTEEIVNKILENFFGSKKWNRNFDLKNEIEIENFRIYARRHFFLKFTT